MEKVKVITLCGSTKFKDEFLFHQKRLTLAGHIVISVGLFGHSGDDEAWIGSNKEMLDKLHLAKIDMSDEIFVINPNLYIGESTRKEIDYAKSKGKEINFLIKPCFVITCIPCVKVKEDFEENQCSDCDNLNWLCFKTEELCNMAFKKQYPEYFNSEGIYKFK